MNRMGNVKRSAREVAGDMPRETFEKAVEAAAKAVCAHRSYRMIAAEVLASVNHAGAVEECEQLRRGLRAALEYLELVPDDSIDYEAALIRVRDALEVNAGRAA